MQGGRVRGCAALVSLVVLSALVLPVPSAGAATVGSLYLSPSTKTVAVGAEVDVQVRLNTGTYWVNVAQTNFTYSTSEFRVLGFDQTGSAFSIIAQLNASDGIIQVAKGSTVPVKGDVLVTTVRFQALAAGTADVCPQDESAAVDPSTFTGIPLSASGGTYVVSKASTFGVSCISHDWIDQGASHSITISGRGFSTAGATVSISGTGVTASLTHVSTSTKITTTLAVSTSAATGFRDVTVTSAGKSNVCKSCLKIDVGPQVGTASPGTVSRGTSGQTVALHGQYLGPQTTVTIAGVTVTSQHWVSFQEIDVTVSVASTATTGYKKISLYDPFYESYGYYGRGSCSTCLSVI